MKKCKCSLKLVLYILLAVVIACCAVWTFIHRRAIRAAIRGEKLPECPHWLPQGVKDKLGV